MRFSPTASVMLVAGGSLVSAGDMQIDFPGFLQPRASAVSAASSVNLFAFSGSLGNAPAPPVTSTGNADRPFAVGGDTFTDFSSAAGRSCDNQHNTCAQTANDGSQKNGALTVSQCDDQATQCESAAAKGPSSAASVSVAAATSSTSSSSPAAQVQTTTASVAQASATLHSSDENFFYFCDP